ncbi:MAG TPA: CpaF family protein, partial [Anaerolineales bacterium]
MTQPTAQKPLSSSDLTKLKRYLATNLAREIESEGIAYEKRSEFIQQRLGGTFEQLHLNLPEDIKRWVFQEVLNDMLGYGPIQPLLDDPDISEIMVNGAKKVYIEKKGQLTRTNVTFDDDAHVL